MGAKITIYSAIEVETEIFGKVGKKALGVGLAFIFCNYIVPGKLNKTGVSAPVFSFGFEIGNSQIIFGFISNIFSGKLNVPDFGKLLTVSGHPVQLLSGRGTFETWEI